jgi:hypothetical protein
MAASRQTQGGHAQREQGPAVGGWRAQLKADSVAEPGPPAGRSGVSRWLSRADRHASRPLAAVLVIGGAGVWIVVSIAAGFPARWETIFQTLVAVGLPVMPAGPEPLGTP